MVPRAAVLAFMFFATASLSSADVSLLIEEAVGGAGEFTGSGHAALHFDRICADDPVTLRMCRPDEYEGIVLSAYPEWGREVTYKWLAIPFNGFLYGVDDPLKVPLYGNGEVRRSLRDAYRRRHLRRIIPDEPDGSIPEGRWTEVLAVTLNRDIYALTVHTTPEQDAAFLEKFQQVPNAYAFNTMFNNCADFVRETLALMFTGAAGRDFVNDFGMTTPKALARSFTQFAKGRPGLLFHIVRYPQIDGTIRRSLKNRNFTEKGLVSKKYALTMITTKPEVLAAFALTYVVSGWFNVDAEYKKLPTAEIASLQLSKTYYPSTVLIASNAPAVATSPIDPARQRARADHEIKALRTELFGDGKYWSRYRKLFEPMLKNAFQEHLFLDREEFAKFYKDMELQSEPLFDSNGDLMLRVEDRGGVLRNVGITSRNILSPESDFTLAYKLLLAKVNYALTAPSRNRLTVPDFEREWAMLQSVAARRRTALDPSSNEADRWPEPGRFRQHEEVVPGSKRAQKLLMEVTH